MSYEWRNTSIKIVLILFVVCIMLFAFSFVNHTSFTGQSFAEAYDLPIGQSMFAGDSVLDDKPMVEVPLLSNPSFIVHEISTLDLKGILLTLTTGFVPFDFSTISSEGINSYGDVYGFEGPGYLTIEGDKLAVKAPDNYIWGYSSPYKVLTKTEDGLDIVENGTVVQSVPTDEIKNLNFSNDFYNVTSILNWYNYDSSVGSNFTLQKGIVGFSDGRNNISYDDVERIFGKEVSDYVDAYPSYSPIVLYMGNTTEIDGEVYYTYLGSHPEYGDSVREFNARQFVEAWNNTVIPPNSSGNGHDYVSFGAASDDEAPGGSAAHGVCPPARALRAAVLAEGFGLPVGMDGSENAVLYGYNPASDIKVTNNHDYPVKIVMWTEGEGTGMCILAKIVRYVPTSDVNSTNMTTNSTSSTDIGDSST
ncbi:hypothetical protein [Methanobrevibacter sp.]|uniref:hypothetical protein n=1 Tax=Methanobrevibacter sp. TaxID=66852 RepID=UPI0025E95E29|nr:hypothetical protein [Methanobrevibacter sp.]